MEGRKVDGFILFKNCIKEVKPSVLNKLNIKYCFSLLSFVIYKLLSRKKY
jgi:hypothetical protein